MKVVDMHCDTISLLLEKEQQGLSSDLFSNDVSMMYKNLEKGSTVSKTLPFLLIKKL